MNIIYILYKRDYSKVFLISCSYSSFDGSGTEYESTVEYVFRLGGAILIDTSPGRNGVNTSF